MKILGFNCKVISIRYLTFESNIKGNKGELLYICNTVVREIGRGYHKFAPQHNIMIYLTKEQYEQRDEETNVQNFIEKNDILTIKETAKWKSKLFKFNTSNPEKVKKANKTQLKINEKGIVYKEERIYAYKVVCQQEDYEIKMKWYEEYYCTIKNSRVRLPLAQKEQVNDTKLDWFLDMGETVLIGKYNNEITEILFYRNNTYLLTKEMLVKVMLNAENGTNYLVLEEAKTTTGNTTNLEEPVKTVDTIKNEEI